MRLKYQMFCALFVCWLSSVCVGAEEPATPAAELAPSEPAASTEPIPTPTSGTAVLEEPLPVSNPAPAAAPAPAAQPAPQAGVPWKNDYAQAVHAAKAARKMLFIYFHSPQPNAGETSFENSALTEANLKPYLPHFEWLRLPTDATVPTAGQPCRLLSCSAFAHMGGRPGIAILDYRNQGQPYFGAAVSQFPLTRYYSAGHVRHMLALPPGTLTQRTMMYAVRTHPSAPRSGWSPYCYILAQEAESHSQHQASIARQGHHNWDQRFQRINARVGGVSKEVVSESWGGEDLLAGAIECVHSWSQSSGHWGAVSSGHSRAAYDMKRGANGVWYATGLFAD